MWDCLTAQFGALQGYPPDWTVELSSPLHWRCVVQGNALYREFLSNSRRPASLDTQIRNRTSISDCAPHHPSRRKPSVHTRGAEKSPRAYEVRQRTFRPAGKQSRRVPAGKAFRGLRWAQLSQRSQSDSLGSCCMAGGTRPRGVATSKLPFRGCAGVMAASAGGATSVREANASRASWPREPRVLFVPLHHSQTLKLEETHLP